MTERNMAFSNNLFGTVLAMGVSNPQGRGVGERKFLRGSVYDAIPRTRINCKGEVPCANGGRVGLMDG